MNSDEDKFYIKILVLDAIYEFVVEKFSIWNHLESQNIILRSHIFLVFWNSFKTGVLTYLPS